jgi:hypothetical protein
VFDKPNNSSKEYGDSQENHAIKASQKMQRQPGIFAGKMVNRIKIKMLVSID